MTNLNTFPGRVRFAATAFRHGRAFDSRRFDDCFEMYDGDCVVAALVRMARADPALERAMLDQLGERVWTDWRATEAKFAWSADLEKEAVAERRKQRADWQRQHNEAPGDGQQFAMF